MSRIYSWGYFMCITNSLPIESRDNGSGATEALYVAPDPYFFLINLFYNKLICFINKLFYFA